MKHLLIFTIGPVQSFIAQARKVQDLFAGSRLLSDLIAEAMIYAKRKAKAQIVYPYFDENKLDADYPNRFVAFVEPENAQEFGKDLENHIQEKFVNDAVSQLSNYLSDEVLNYAEKQLEHILKIYWVILPEVDENNYHEKIEEAERLLGGIKNLRKFEHFAETGRKCSLNGEYNVIIYHHDTEKPEPYWLSYTKPVEVKKHFDLGLLAKGEALSAISFYKRLYKREQNKFDATCEIAYLDTIEIDKKQYTELAKDVQLIYEDNRTDRVLKKSNINKDKLNNELKELFDAIPKGNKPQKYYAVLMFDADRMGRWIAGDYLKEKTKLLEFQKELSKLLSEFAQFAKRYIDGKEDGEKKGQTIYAGGDDYLGLINLKHLFPVLETLRENFKEIVSEKIKDYVKDNKELTFSAGVVIAHYKTPLSFVLKEARATEKSAKDDGDRDAVAFTVLKRSGEIHRSVMKWYEDDTFLPKELYTIIKTLRSKQTSNKFITNLTQEFDPVANKNINADLVKAELKRLLRLNEVQKLENAVFTLFDHLVKNEGELYKFIQLLNIADFISRNINKIEN